MMPDPSLTPSVQFTKAEYAEAGAAAATCVLCQQTLAERYFEVNGQVTCPDCTEQIQQAHDVRPGVGGFAKAVLTGVSAGVAGALLYYGVLALTGYEFGLIAVVVGFMVGRAVRWGSSGRGGAIYQALAVALTYLAIVSCYVPYIIEGIRSAEPHQATESVASTPSQAAAEAPAPPTRAQIAFFLVIFAGIVLASPFLGGFGNIIGWLIIGFALYEAWKSNRRVEVTVTGPHSLVQASTA
jgi:hypothetical protein